MTFGEPRVPATVTAHVMASKSIFLGLSLLASITVATGCNLSTAPSSGSPSSSGEDPGAATGEQHRNGERREPREPERREREQRTTGSGEAPEAARRAHADGRLGVVRPERLGADERDRERLRRQRG